MRKMVSLSVIVMFCYLVSDPSIAQQSNSGRRALGGNGRIELGLLLANGKVQKELELTTEQVEKIRPRLDALDEARPNYQPGGNAAALSGPERRVKAAKFRDLTNDFAREVAAILNDAQNLRLSQIQLWAGGAIVLFVPEIAQQLEISPKQMQALGEENAKAARKHRDLIEEIRPTNEERKKQFRDRTAQVAAECDANCFAILSDAQRDRLEQLRGPRFELSNSSATNDARAHEKNK